MTPLAQRVVRELTLPLKDRTFEAIGSSFLDRMSDVHCFECSDVVPALEVLANKVASAGFGSVERFAFLPAPKTWIEYEVNGKRLGFLLEDVEGNGIVAGCHIIDGTQFASAPIAELPLGEKLNSRNFYPVGEIERDICYKMAPTLYAALALINTPKLIGRTTHMPHAGLQRRLAKMRGIGPGKFPLNAWTEIKLRIGLPKEVSGDQAIWLSGRRALHFVRCHLRIRRGQVELVSAHWRGDPALGIKQSRYKLVPEAA